MSISNIHFATLHPTSVEGAKAVQHLRFNVTVRRMNMSTASFMSKEGQRTMLNRNPQKRTSQLPTCKSADKNEALTHPSLPFDGRPRLHHHPPSPRLRHFQLATNLQLHRRLRFRRPLLHHQGMPPSPIPHPTPSNPPPSKRPQKAATTSTSPSPPTSSEPQPPISSAAPTISPGPSPTPRRKPTFSSRTAAGGRRMASRSLGCWTWRALRVSRRAGGWGRGRWWRGLGR